MQYSPNIASNMIELPEWSFDLFEPHRYKVPHGGRGSAKSWTVARALIMIANEPWLLFGDGRTSVRILCARELQNSIEESVHHLLVEQIELLHLQAYFDVQQRSIKHKINGSEFIFSGIQKNVNKIKSMEGIDIVWVEEAEKVSKNSLKVLIPTIRKPGSELWFTFNPDQEDDPTYQKFITNPPPNTWSRLVNHRDNPWFPEELRKEMLYDFSVDPETAQHVWEGACNTRSEAVIFRGKYIVEHFTPVTGRPFDEENWNGPYYGADWGFSNDPCVLTKSWIHDGNLYIEKESWGIGVELDDIGPMWKLDIPEVEDAGVIRADSSRPETISHVKNKSNLPVRAAEKWTGSVEDGIAFFRSFRKIIFHPRCKHHIKEAANYKYKVDPVTEDVTRVIIDKHNHCWDADRYAFEPAIKNKKSIYNVL